MANDNKELGLFKLDGIAPARRGVPQIEVKFDIDVNGIVHVSATDKGTGKQQSITIQNSSGLSDDEIDRMVKEAEEHKAEDDKRKEEIDLRNRAEAFINQIDMTIADAGDKIDAAQKEQTIKLRDELQKSLDEKQHRQPVRQCIRTHRMKAITAVPMMITLLMRNSKKRTNRIQTMLGASPSLVCFVCIPMKL